MPLKLNSTGGGSVTLDTPSTAGTYTVTVPASNQTLGITSGTAVTVSGSPTYVDFTGIPSWAKRITVLFNGVSTSGASAMMIQLGTGSTTYTTSGYTGYGSQIGASSNSVTSVTTGLPLHNQALATNTYWANSVITNVTGNTWMAMALTQTGSAISSGGLGLGGGSVALGATLTAIRITTVGGTDTFDTGSIINIMYEG